jgi:hypothetical protein
MIGILAKPRAGVLLRSVLIVRDAPKGFIHPAHGMHQVGMTKDEGVLCVGIDPAIPWEVGRHGTSSAVPHLYNDFFRWMPQSTRVDGRPEPTVGRRRR